ncbi:Thiol-disulfide isomerase or thioredoxin [Sulfurivirga caldicuralii]|uniref:Thiol-disulfide isomerase or thioredoxin n=1 Tax=Sulfurivirga caldicuralii TaxID=364032 RepID=A0A1N6GBS1_9GAMM|nr:redoxin domain-containing protein [Sulfurivirga caldicuralii]SIO04999.1 Thiol-disulfide isomerase or thioredoxin [Sulfurivirga caldicuralii]
MESKTIRTKIRAFLRQLLGTLLLMVLVFQAVQWWQTRQLAHDRLPVEALTTLTGKPLPLDSLPHPYLIHFTASWCPICKLTAPAIASINEQWPVVQIITQSGNKDAAIEYAKDHDIPLDRAVNDPDGRLLKLFGAEAVPADFFVGRDGTIRMNAVGIGTAWGYRLRLWWLSL